MRLKSALVLAALIAISFGVAALGSLATIENVDGWYATAEKAAWNPPNAIFGPVWTLLYLLMSVAAWLVWRQERRIPVIYIVQLALNAIWTPMFFGAYPLIGTSALWIGFAIILAIDATVLLTMLRFWKSSRLAAWLLVPYWAWVLFATTLNLALAILN